MGPLNLVKLGDLAPNQSLWHRIKKNKFLPTSLTAYRKQSSEKPQKVEVFCRMLWRFSFHKKQCKLQPQSKSVRNLQFYGGKKSTCIHTIQKQTWSENSKFVLSIRVDTRRSSCDLVLAYCCNLGGELFLFPVSLLHYSHINYLY